MSIAIQEKADCVFQSAGQAVHVAYVILAQEAQQDAPLRKALIRAMESVNLVAKGQREWLEQLRGESSGTVNFGGLGMEDVRAQCVLVTRAVATKLPAPEMWALQAKFGQTEHEDVDGRRRFAFSVERINAIKRLSDWLRPSFPSLSGFALDCMLGKLYADHKRIEISYRDLAKSFGGTHPTYSRAFKRMKLMVRELEQQAFTRLEAHLRQQGVVGDFD